MEEGIAAARSAAAGVAPSKAFRPRRGLGKRPSWSALPNTRNSAPSQLRPTLPAQRRTFCRLIGVVPAFSVWSEHRESRTGIYRPALTRR